MYALLCLKEGLAEQYGKQGNNSLVGQEQPILLQQHPSRLERFPLALEVFDIYDT